MSAYSRILVMYVHNLFLDRLDLISILIRPGWKNVNNSWKVSQQSDSEKLNWKTCSDLTRDGKNLESRSRATSRRYKPSRYISVYKEYYPFLNQLRIDSRVL